MLRRCAERIPRLGRGGERSLAFATNSGSRTTPLSCTKRCRGGRLAVGIERGEAGADKTGESTCEMRPAEITCAQHGAAGQPPAESVVTPELTDEDERTVGVVEDAITRGRAVRMRYQSRSGAAARWRNVTVHRVVWSNPVRMVVTCHESGELRWFRLDHVREVAVDEREPSRKVDEDKVREYLASSVDGFHEGMAPTQSAFLVREPEARWVADNLPMGWKGEFVSGGLRVTACTAALGQVARFVVGLGGAARAETPELVERVRELAHGALNGCAADSIRTRG